MARFLLLGSGELGKEFVIAAQRMGHWVIAADRYAHAPAMQVAQEFEVINMLDGDALDQIVVKHKPDFIVPEIEAIRTERLYQYEEGGITVVPSAKATVPSYPIVIISGGDAYPFSFTRSNIR